MNEHDIHHYWKEIINTMHDGMVLISPEGMVLMANRAMEEITGYTSEELIGNSCQVFHCDACQLARSEGKGKWCELFDLGLTHKKRCSLLRKDGSCLHVLKNASLLRDSDGNVLGAVETVTDITEIDKRDQKIEQLSRLLDADSSFHGMVGASPAMEKVFEITEKASRSDAPVIIFGETGTGKELVARAIHNLGRRRDGPYIQLNCAALNEALLESELFGHIKGAFTGAYNHREGRFAAAHGGDIFLDEIGDVPIPIQIKLLRVLETKQFERVGDHRSMSVDARIITATNRNLELLVSQGRFRDDFFFRINVIPIHLPPLRERIEDVPLLVQHFIAIKRNRREKEITGLSPEAMGFFMAYHWPGNVRELKSALEYAFVIAERGLIHPEHLPTQMTRPTHGGKQAIPRVTTAHSGEKDALIEALIESGGNQSQAARILGVNRVTVWHRIQKHGIDIRQLDSP
jgi:two-component system, NtrC family, response regulator HydG